MSVFRASSRALITGGASGIGLAVAQVCVAHGMHVTVVDSNAATLSLAENSLGGVGKGGEVKCVKADVSTREGWEKIKAEAGEEVDFLMLNAGVGGQGGWGNEAYFDKILQTNLFGVVNGLNAYAPSLQSRSASAEHAAIVITGSKQGITNPPGNPAYNASKAAVKTLAEHLSWDLRDKKNIGVHLLVPGWTFTGLSGNVPGTEVSKPAGAWSPSQVAEYLIDKMSKGSFYIICPDNDVTVETDKKRMLWAVGDIVEDRPPLTRWRDEWKDEVAKRM